jgi:hypothetical protein
MVACVTGFHRKKVRPARDPVFATLKKSRRREVLALAALLRLGDALDYSQGQTCAIAEVGVVDGALVITVAGEFADFNAARAQKMSDLWAELYNMPVRVQARRPVEVADETAWLTLDPTLNLAEALRLLTDRVAVMYLGKIVEMGPSAAVFDQPQTLADGVGPLGYEVLYVEVRTLVAEADSGGEGAARA